LSLCNLENKLFFKKKNLIFIFSEDDEEIINLQRTKYLKKKVQLNIEATQTEAQTEIESQTETEAQTETELPQVKIDLTRVSFFLF